ncbi:putative palmitoyltransferase zdhhc1, partial [Xenoophorus captivus]
MDVCGRNPNRTAPVSEDAPRRSDVPLCSRTNGWSWPPHPFQLLAWLLYVYFAVTGFGVFVPLLPAHWIPAGYIVSFLCTGTSVLLPSTPAVGVRGQTHLSDTCCCWKCCH